MVCPTKPALPNGYGYNSALSKMPLAQYKLPAETLLSADAQSSRADNLITTTSDIDLRHNGGFYASYLDGHVSLIKDVTTVKLAPGAK